MPMEEARRLVGELFEKKTGRRCTGVEFSTFWPAHCGSPDSTVVVARRGQLEVCFQLTLRWFAGGEDPWEVEGWIQELLEENPGVEREGDCALMWYLEEEEPSILPPPRVGRY